MILFQSLFFGFIFQKKINLLARNYGERALMMKIIPSNYESSNVGLLMFIISEPFLSESNLDLRWLLILSFFFLIFNSIP